MYHLWLSIKLLLYFSATFCLLAFGSLALRLASDSRLITASVQQTLGETQVTLKQTDSAVTDLRRTLEVAGGTLNIARDTLRNEQASIKEANAQTIATMRGLDELVQNSNHLVTSANASQQQVVADTHATMVAIQSTVAQTSTVIDSINKTATDPSIAATLGHINGVADNLQNTSKHLDNVAAYYDKNLTSPRGFVSTLYHGILQLITPGASLALVAK